MEAAIIISGGYLLLMKREFVLFMWVQQVIDED
jgi:hypothetical protein